MIFLHKTFDFQKQNMSNVAVDGIPLKWYKRNLHNTYGLSERNGKFYSMRFFLSDIDEVDTVLEIYWGK